MADTSFDVIIIGSGPGGYVTAIRAAQLGFKTAIVEKQYLGGICLNWGCIPTKALLRSAEIYHYMQHAKDYGLSAEKVSYDPKAVVQRSRGVSKRLNDGVGFLMKKNKVSVIWGEASIEASPQITLTLFFFIRKPTPSLSRFDTARERLTTAAGSYVTVPAERP